ncbi:phenazine antibiotic biosynthesis protein [Janthinobacterium sp. ROICE36]|uniref:anthranilate synthase family protein n=1 Tax=Janthinobacterium sp. ROICE36 TaxID=2048670 RepID=UPI000C7ECB9C|nr:anthranilate synthase family protein [Janthinobacterium sp. ROICE36]PLY42141.1 phenazine antibiotic biosynthesis protein [Janthinobacterium sp. ROICE36]
MTASLAAAQSVLRQAIEGGFNAYALVYRPGRFEEPTLEVLIGTEKILESLSELERIQDEQRKAGRWGSLLVVPYRQIEERGFTVIDDDARLLAIAVDQCRTIPLEQAFSALPDVPVNIDNAHFSPDDEAYEDIVKKVIEREIGAGEGANFVIKRTFAGNIADYEDQVGLTIFRNLLRQEKGAYWTFFIRLGDITLVGASPEKHIKVDGKSVSMTPISGTYRFPSTGPTQDGLLSFLDDSKEEDELSMVLDEELKMMTDICSSAIRVHGPYFVEMSRLAHIGYRITGESERSLSDILKRSMFAPTVVGSPLENATRVIARYETRGRSYYSGFAAVVESGGNGPMLDSAIIIRTAEISNSGRMEVGVGATLVRDSHPILEMKETAAKVSAMRNAMGIGSGEASNANGTTANSAGAANALAPGPLPAQHSSSCWSAPVQKSLTERNERLSKFWLNQDFSTPFQDDGPAIVILDNEDAFTSMMEYQLRQSGLAVEVKSYPSIGTIGDREVLIVGPGPGDPRKLDDPRVATSRRLMLAALEQNQPFISVCFGHQILCSLLGLKIERLVSPNQGLQKEISIFGQTETVGFYNTFAAVCEVDSIRSRFGEIQVYRDPETKQVHGLKGTNFCSMQFHPESVLTKDGFRILSDAVFSMRAVCS